MPRFPLARPSLRVQRVLIFLLPLFLSLPFLNRAYFVDDSYFVEIATWLKDNPELPYHFRADDAGLQTRGWEEDGFVRMVNPLVHHYYLALLLKAGGEREWLLRLGCVLLSCFSGLFLFSLARRWTGHPFLAAALALVTPAVWLTAHSLLIDSTLLFFFLGGLFFFTRALEDDSLLLYSLSGIFMGLGILTKYPGVLVFPVTAAWLALERPPGRRWWPAFWAWGLAAAFLLGYSAWTNHLYGAPHILAASERMVRVFGWPKFIVFSVFFSGATLVPAAAWGAAGIRKAVVAGLLAFLTAVLLASSLGGFTPVQAGLLGFWFVTSFLFFAVWLKAQPQWRRTDVFLSVWILAFLGMMLLVMDWVAVRYFTVVAPALAVVAVRLAEIRRGPSADRHGSALLAAAFILTAMVGYADYQQAATSRAILARLRTAGIEGGPRRFFLGDSFTTSYLKEENWVPAFDHTEFRPGDLILAKEVTMPQIWWARRGLVLQEVARFDFPARFPVRVMDYHGSAGFYASVWGALPFTLSNGPWERFRLFQVLGTGTDAVPKGRPIY